MTSEHLKKFNRINERPFLVNKYQNCLEVEENGTDQAGSSGTAFFINKKGYLLTNNHVVEGCSLSKISYKNNDYDTKLIATDRTLDLALLKSELKPKTFINFSDNDVKKLDTIYVAGYPLGKEGLSDDLKMNPGVVSSLKGFDNNSNEIQIDAAINSGNSGGPIINANGDLVAITVSGMAKDQTEGINFGIKSSAAERFLKSNNINFNKSLNSRSKNKEQLRNILEEGTVYTYCN
jgi:S1-C subfamily serine protease